MTAGLKHAAVSAFIPRRPSGRPWQPPRIHSRGDSSSPAGRSWRPRHASVSPGRYTSPVLTSPSGSSTCRSVSLGSYHHKQSVKECIRVHHKQLRAYLYPIKRRICNDCVCTCSLILAGLLALPSAKSGAFILFPLAMPRLLSYCLACNHAAISQTRDTRSQAMVDCLCTHVALQEASEDHAEQRAL